MDYQSVAEAAQNWGISPRQVQRLLAENRIAGAQRYGRTWLIPRTAEKPADHRRSAPEKNAFEAVYDMDCALPLLRSVFTPGKCRETIDAMPPTAQQLARAELSFYTAHTEETIKLCEELIGSENVCLRLSALVLTALASVSSDGEKAHECVKEISDYYNRVKDAAVPDELRAMALFALLTPSVLLHIDYPTAPEPEGLIRYLPEGLKLWGYYICAFILYLRGDYEEAIGTAKAALNMYEQRRTIVNICLELLISMTLMELKRTTEAQSFFMSAWTKSQPDGLIWIFGEHHAALQGLIESQLKKSDPEAYRVIVTTADAFSSGRKKLHALPPSTKSTEETLGATERIIAALAVRGWTNTEIAVHMGLSVHTIKKYISVIYEKLDISGRKELKTVITRRKTQ